MTSTPDVGGSSAVGETPRPRGDERSLGDIVSDITQDLTTLMRQELDLAKTELKEEAVKVGKGAGMLGAAGLAGYFFILFASLTAIFVLDTFLDLWLSALIVTLVWAVLAAVLGVLGRSNLKAANPQLPTTQQTLKEDVQWAKAQKN